MPVWSCNHFASILLTRNLPLPITMLNNHGPFKCLFGRAITLLASYRL